MSKCILLVRVSTTEQEYESQLKDLINYSKSLGYEEYIVIADKESAIKLSEEERQGLNDMKKHIEDDSSINAVFVWEISRIARTEKVLFSIRDYLVAREIQLYIFDKKYKLLNDDKTLNEETSILFSLYAYLATSEMRNKKKRFARARQRNNELGKWNGSHIVYGYTTDEYNYIIIDRKEQSIIIELFNKYLEDGFTIADLYRYCLEKGYTLFTHNYVQYLAQMLRNRSYIGENQYGVKYPQLLDKELFDKVQEKLRSIKTYRRTTNIYLGKGFIHCPCEGCQRHLSPRLGAAAYSCSLHFKNTNISINAIDTAIWMCANASYNTLTVSKFDENKDQYSLEIQENEEIIKRLNELNDEAYMKSQRASKMYILGKIDEKSMDEVTKEIEDEKKRNDSRINELIARNAMLNSLITNQYTPIIVNDDDYEAKYKIVKETIDKVEIAERIHNEHIQFDVYAKYSMNGAYVMHFKWMQKKHILLVKGVDDWIEVPITRRFERRKY